MSRTTASQDFTPRLTTTDWGAEWIQLQKKRQAADDAAFWNERAQTFGNEHAGTVEPSPYATQFLKLAQILPGESVFDMGCGNGALACPLACAGHHVIAADFSQNMIASLEDKCRQFNVDGIETKVMSWDDDWSRFGITDDCVDVAIASRSISTADIEDSLDRLSRVARRRACITLPTGSSPRADTRILRAIGIEDSLGRDYLYAFMILTHLGYFPEVSYIASERIDTFDTKQEAVEELGKMLGRNIDGIIDADEIARARERLSSWLDDNLVDNEHAGAPGEKGPQKKLRLKTPRTIRWAFLSWDTRQI